MESSNYNAQTRFCKRCLLQEITDERALYEVIREQISLMADDMRTPSDLYLKRLKRCGACEHLNRGTCVRCGCYVELRAAKKHMGCADVPDRWKDIE